MGGEVIKGMIEKVYEYKIGNLYVVFVAIKDDCLKLVHCSEKPYNAERKLDQELIEASTLAEIQITGMNQPNHKGNKLGNTLVGRNLRLKTIEQSENKLTVVQFYKEKEIDIEVTTTIDGTYHPNVLKWENQIENKGKEIGIEYITSLNILDVLHSDKHDFSKNILYLPHNAWQGEYQWQSASLKEFGLNCELDGEHEQDSTKVIEATNNSSWSCAQYSPFAVIIDPEEKRTAFFQIENNGEWHWELTDCNYGKNLALRAGGPTEVTNHWWKLLKTGEKFKTIPVAYGISEGDFNTAIEILNSYRRNIRRKSNDVEELPVIFNDYMNCLMGDPTTEKEIKLIDCAAEVGCEYYVIDCGWYSDGYWWDNVGEWKPSIKRFPEGLSFVTDYIRKKGMIPGAWLEIEVMGINSKLANSLPDDWFICRHGERVRDHSRYHLDFRNEEVQKYAGEVIDRLVKEYGFGYIKMDYNTCTGIGSDIRADSLSDALLQHNRAYLKWMDKIMKAYPELVIENCGSGGMRHDYAMLKRHSIQSVTDQTDYLRNGAIAAACCTAITPEQAAIWSYPMKGEDEEEVAFNMVNAMLFRIHQSGQIDKIEKEKLNLVKEGIDVYKSIRSEIKMSKPVWFGKIPHLDDPWFSFALENEKEILLAVWRTDSKDDFYEIDLNENVKKIEQIYPANENIKAKETLKDNHKVGIYFSHNKMARLYKIIK